MADSTFWPTFWATSAGAGVGIVGLIGVFWRESRDRYEARLTDALKDVCFEIREIIPVGDDPSAIYVQENSIRISIALDVAAMVAKGEDLKFVRALSDVILDLKVGGGETVRNALHKVLISITGWRSRAKPREFYVNWIKDVSSNE